MKTQKLSIKKEEDILLVTKLAKKVIAESNYYNQLARKAEKKKFHPAKIKENLRNKTHIYLIAKNNKKMIGFLSGYFDAETFWIEWMLVDKKHRQTRIGSLLLVEIEKIIKKHKIHKIWCDTLKHNKEAISLYKKYGFRKICLIKNHWYKQDFYLWQKEIN